MASVTEILSAMRKTNETFCKGEKVRFLNDEGRWVEGKITSDNHRGGYYKVCDKAGDVFEKEEDEIKRFETERKAVKASADAVILPARHAEILREIKDRRAKGDTAKELHEVLARHHHEMIRHHNRLRNVCLTSDNASPEDANEIEHHLKLENHHHKLFSHHAKKAK